MVKIAVLDRSALPPECELLRPDFAHQWESWDLTPYDQVVERAAEAQMVLTSKVRLDRAVLEQLPHLKYIGLLATGYNNIDMAAAVERGIAVTNVQGYSTEAVAEHTVGMMLYLARRLGTAHRAIAGGSWSRSPTFWQLPGGMLSDLKGRTLTIAGVGAIGGRIGELARAFGMKIIKAEHKGASAVRPGYTEFTAALKAADVLTVNCPLTAATANLIDKAELALLKPHCLVLNNSRGGIINEEALVQALEQGKIGGAGADVASTEPLPADHPFNRVRAYDNFILTPHQAWMSGPALTELVRQVKENMEAFAAGRRLRRVD